MWWSNVTAKYPRFYLLAPIVLVLVLLFQKTKNMQIITKSQKHFFYNKPWSQIKWPLYFYSFVNQKLQSILIIFQVIFPGYKKHKQIYFATWLFILKPFSKLIKNTKTNQTSIFTPNYEVLIPHGYVGKGHSSFQINKKCR